MAYNLDEIDLQILRILQDDGRITIKALGKEIHMSPASVNERIAHMTDCGIIMGYSAVVNPAAMGKYVTATVVVMYHDGMKNQFLEFIKDEDEIITADEVPGKSDAILLIHSQNMDTFLALLSKIRHYGDTDCYFHMQHYKKSPVLPCIN